MRVATIGEAMARQHSRRVRRVLLTGAAMAMGAVSASVPLAGQALTGWRTVHIADEYDYLMSLESITPIADADGVDEIIGVHLSKMLVRLVEETRPQVSAARRAAGRPTDGYDAYASSTDVLWIKCEERAISIRQTIDFASDGSTLDRWEPAPVWQGLSKFRGAPAVLATFDWICNR